MAKNYETIVNYSNYSLLLYFYARDSRIELEHALSNLKMCLCHNNIICSYEKKNKSLIWYDLSRTYNRMFMIR